MPDTIFRGFNRDNGLHVYVAYVDRGPMNQISILRAFDDAGEVELTTVEKCRFHFELEKNRSVPVTTT